MNEIKELIKKVRETQKLANTRLDDIDFRYRQGTAVAMRRAQEELPKLLDELKQATIPGRLVAIFAKGDQSVINKVGQFLKENGGIVIDANEMYARIGDRIEGTYSNTRTFGTTQFSLMIDELHAILGLLNIAEVPAPRFIDKICPDSRATINHIRELVRKACGDNLNLAYLTKKLSDEVIGSEVDAKRIPILMMDVSSPEEKALFNTLFSSSVEHNFTNTFQVDKKSILKLLKSSQNGDSAATEEENTGE